MVSMIIAMQLLAISIEYESMAGHAWVLAIQ